jgi:hypothetical protein
MVGSARITHGWPRPAGHGAIPIRTDPPKKKAERGCAVGLGIGLEGRLAYVAHDFPLASAEQWVPARRAARWGMWSRGRP